jgi:hypothetical protein
MIININLLLFWEENFEVLTVCVECIAQVLTSHFRIVVYFVICWIKQYFVHSV